jgi:hypothetical protein
LGAKNTCRNKSDGHRRNPGPLTSPLLCTLHIGPHPIAAFLKVERIKTPRAATR